MGWSSRRESPVSPLRPPRHPDASKDPERSESLDDSRGEGRTRSAPPSAPPHDDKLTFLTENADETSTRLCRACDDSGLELFAAFLPDGRVRIADDDAHRFAGMIENGRADLLDVANNQWSELFLYVNPNGETQFELRGGPYDAHVLTVQPIDNLRMTND